MGFAWRLRTFEEQISLESKFYLKPNWQRHFLRSYLSTHNVKNNLINTWLGHDGIGGNVLSKFSSTKIGDLSCISELIDKAFEDLKIPVLSHK